MKPIKATTRREKRKVRIRKRIRGSAERPRLCVFRSSRFIYAQLIDDQNQRTIGARSSNQKSFDPKLQGKANREAANAVGKAIAELAKEKKISEVIFDRNGYGYHGRVRAVAEGAREAGLKF